MIISPRNGHSMILEEPSTVPLLTVENYCKWYTVWLVHPDGRVEEVDMYAFKCEGTVWSDHVPHPKSCIEVANQLGVEWDDESFELIVGRYMLEKMPDELNKLLGIKDDEE